MTNTITLHSDAFDTTTELTLEEIETGVLLLEQLLEEVLQGNFENFKFSNGNRYCGICRTWEKMGYEHGTDTVEHIAKDWPQTYIDPEDGTPDGLYPIGGYDELTLDQTMWEGNRLAKRISLMRFIIARMHEWIQELR